ncbi:MAG: hypothetical protein GQ557_02480 [Mycoplasmataceae bacterium]|nr:hypothetical protein [Mycoplasmataceae bacterium]
MNDSFYAITKKVNNKTKHLLYSKQLIIFVTIIITIVTIISFWSFYFNQGTISGHSYQDLKDSNWAWVSYFWFSVAIMSSFFGIVGDVYLHRNDKKCFFFYFGYIFVFVFYAMILFLWYDLIQELLVLVLVLMAYKNWGHQEKSDPVPIKVQSSKMMITYWVLIIGLSLFFGWIMILILGDTSFADPKPFLDAFTTLTFFAGWILMVKKYLNAYLVYAVGTIASLVINLTIHSWIHFSTDIIYIALYFIGFNNWIQIYYEQSN